MKNVYLQIFALGLLWILIMALGLYNLYAAKPKSGYVDYVEELCYKHRVTDACNIIQGKKKKECK